MKLVRYYLNIFLIFSMLGFIMETILKFCFFSSMNNGILNGPWIPIYGVGCCIIIAIMKFVFNKIRVNRILKIVIFVILSILILTILEYITGNLIEMITGDVFWDYSKLKYNYGNYICLEISLCWGIGSLIVVYILKPRLDKTIKKIPSWLTYLVFFIFLIDCIFTFL